MACKNKIFLSILVGLLINTLNISKVFAYKDYELSNIAIYEKISPSIVSVDGKIAEDEYSSGTGCIITKEGLILTSKHILEGVSEIKIKLYNGKELTGNIVRCFEDGSDLALIKIYPQEALIPVKLGNSQNVKVGQKVLAIGNPFGFNNTLTIGIVSRIDKQRNKIQTDAAINPGSSGGPLIDTNAEVIGINQSIYNPDNNKSNIGIGFAVPIDTAKKFLK